MYPPYCYLTSVLLSGKDELAVERCAEGFANFLNGKLENVNILGPARAVISRIDNEYRYRILIKYKQSQPLFKLLKEALNHYQGKVKIEVDVNPYVQL